MAVRSNPRAGPIRCSQYRLRALVGFQNSSPDFESILATRSSPSWAPRLLKTLPKLPGWNWFRERGVTLISAGLDEVPIAYKNIREVMADQSDLVTTLGQFDPKLVKMAPSGERPED